MIICVSYVFTNNCRMAYVEESQVCRISARTEHPFEVEASNYGDDQVETRDWPPLIGCSKY